ncbi:Membrane protein SypL involved in exopolysaccharide production [Pseudoalteromonas luteoviolacea B = ATCC 29581]|nr:Membrane protein SypL involved in exopolysaccharide production [Pseudoalteromonas luteoviolacea B = ATCC 29581]
MEKRPNWFERNKLTIVGLTTAILMVVVYDFAGIIPAVGLMLLPFAAFTAVRVSTTFVILFILFSYFRIHEAFPVLMPFKIPLLLALASLFAISWHLFISQKLIPYWHSCHVLFLTFFFWLTVCTFMATDRGSAIGYWSGVLTKVAIMVYAISWWVRKLSYFTWIRIGIMVSGVMIAIVAISNKLQGIGLVEGTRVTISRELRSQLGDPNDLSLVLMFPISFMAAEVFNKEGGFLRRGLATLGLIALCWGIIATQSRGGLLGICSVMGYFLYQRIRNPIIVGAIGVVGLLGLLAFAGVADRQSGGSSEDGIDESAMGRIYAWQAAFNMALANPLTGVGINNFYSNYFFYSPHWDGKNHAVHSTWFQVMGETGFVGLALFIVLLVGIYKSLNRSLRLCNLNPNNAILLNVHSLRAGLLAFCVGGTFLTQAFTWPLYIILSLSIAVEKLVLDYEEARHDKQNKTMA